MFRLEEILFLVDKQKEWTSVQFKLEILELLKAREIKGRFDISNHVITYNKKGEKNET